MPYSPSPLGVIIPALTRIRRTDRLRRCRQRAKAYNPYALDVATGVTMTIGASLDASLTKINNCQVTGPLPATSRYRFTGGVAQTYGSGIKLPVSSCLGATGTTGNLGNYASGLNNEIHFTTEAAKLAIVMTPQAGTYPTTVGIKVLVNGRYVSKTVTPYPASGVNYITLDFGGVRDEREIKIENTQGPAIFGGVYTPPGDDVRATVPAEPLLLLGFGDSYGDPAGVGVTDQAAVKKFGNLIGASDSRQFSIGGSAYSYGGNSVAGVPRFVGQIPNHFALNTDIDPAKVDVITMIGGLNDWSLNNAFTGNQPLTTAAQMQPLVTEWLTAIRALCPNALILVSGVMCITRNLDAVTLAMEAGVSAAVSAWSANDPLVAFVPMSTAPIPFQYGTGKSGTPTNNGPNDNDLSSDGVHPTDAGYTRLAGRFVAAYDALLANLAA